MTPEQKELLENWNHNPCRGDYCKDVNALLAAQRAKDAEAVDSAIGWLVTPDMKRPLRTPYESYLFNKLIGLRKEMYKRIYNQNES